VSFLESDHSDQLTVDWGQCSSLKHFNSHTPLWKRSALSCIECALV